MVGRRRHNYNATVIGVPCGHVCSAWPTIRESGKDKVFCDVCEQPVEIKQPDKQLTLFDSDTLDF